MSNSFITKTPRLNFKVDYGLDNPIVVTLAMDLFGFDLRFLVYKELRLPKILDIPLGEKLSFITFEQNGKTKTRINLMVNQADSILIPMLKAPLKNLWDEECELIPTCYYDLIGTIAGKDELILSGGLQGTPSGKGAI